MLKQKERKKKKLLCSIWRHDFGVWWEHAEQHAHLPIFLTTSIIHWVNDTGNYSIIPMKVPFETLFLNFCTIPSLNDVLRNFILEKLCVFFFPFFLTWKQERKTPTSIFTQAVNSLLPGCQKVLILEKKNDLAFSKFRDCSWTGKAKKLNDVGMS